LTYREARLGDVPAIVRLVDSAYRGETSRQGWTHEADLLDGSRTDTGSVAAIVERADSTLLLVEHDELLVGCCHLELRDQYAYFGMFAIRPDRQGGGLGKAVLAEAERRVRARWRVGEMRMTVLAQRAELISYYERRGYRRTGKVLDFPYGDDRFGVPRRADLALELLVKALDVEA
jgi:N-acetylglutamate synthase-like GNAT family acetyltransferase